MMGKMHLRAGRKALVAGCAAFSVGAVVAGCGSSSSSSTPASSSAAFTSAASTPAKSITIGFSPPNQSAPALIGLGKALQAYAQSKGDKVVVADPNNNPTTQVQQLQSWIQLGKVQAIWVLALDPSTMASVLPLAASHHVAMLATGVPSDYGKSGPGPGLSFSIINYAQFGHAVGVTLGKCVNARLGGNGQILDVENPPGSTDLAAENAAFLAGLKATSPNSKVVATVSSGNAKLAAQQASLSAIQGHPGINGVAGFTDEGSLGSLAALKLSGKNPSTTACAVGAGGNPMAIADVKAGTEYGYTVIGFKDDLVQNVNEMAKMAANPSATGVQLYTPFSTMTHTP
jgi:ABC-type sugar transport system substrate-binding protein